MAYCRLIRPAILLSSARQPIQWRNKPAAGPCHGKATIMTMRNLKPENHLCRSERKNRRRRAAQISFAKSPKRCAALPILVIYVFGEKPYAEFKGDMSDLVFEFDDGQALNDLAALKKRNVPVVSYFLTGRPLWVNPHINRADAFVVGWLARHTRRGNCRCFIRR